MTAEAKPIFPGRRIRLWLEMTAVYIGAPLAIYAVVFGFGLALFFVLLPAFAAIIVFLLLDRDFSVVGMLRRGFPFSELKSILGLFIVLGAAILWFTATTHPDWFLSFPRRAPRLWLVVMLAYPLASVAAQELFYRVIYFHRYGVLFGDRAGLAILLNGVLFGFAHVIFHNWPAVVISGIGGAIFAWRYRRTGSLWAVGLEHSLYGGLIFTSGLGRYFFTGVSI